MANENLISEFDQIEATAIEKLQEIQEEDFEDLTKEIFCLMQSIDKGEIELPSSFENFNKLIARLLQYGFCSAYLKFKER